MFNGSGSNDVSMILSVNSLLRWKSPYPLNAALIVEAGLGFVDREDCSPERELRTGVEEPELHATVRWSEEAVLCTVCSREESVEVLEGKRRQISDLDGTGGGETE